MKLKGFSRDVRTPIGIDVGGAWIKAVQLGGRPGGHTVEAATAYARQAPGDVPNGAEVDRLCEVLYRQHFVGRDVVLAMPRQKLLTGMLDLPPRTSDAPLDQIARAELARLHRSEPEALEVAWWDVPAPEAGRANESGNALAVACATDDAQAYLDLFEERGLNVVALDAQPCAVARACAAALTSGASGLAVILDLGWSGTRLVLLRRKVVVYERALPEFALRRLMEQVCAKFGLSEEMAGLMMFDRHPAFRSPALLCGAETGGQGVSAPAEMAQEGLQGEVAAAVTAYFDPIVTELQTAMAYAAQRFGVGMGQGVSELLLIGGGACARGLDEFLSRQLELRAEALSPAKLAQWRGGESATLGHSPALVAAIGLALHREVER